MHTESTSSINTIYGVGVKQTEAHARAPPTKTMPPEAARQLHTNQGKPKEKQFDAPIHVVPVRVSTLLKHVKHVAGPPPTDLN